MKLLNKIAEVVFPSYHKCIICAEEIQNRKESGICNLCEAELTQIEHPCLKCGESLHSAAGFCLRCKKSKAKNGGYSFEQARAVYEYEGGVKFLIRQFKYDGAKYLAKYLAAPMSKLLAETEWKVNAVAAVPLCEMRKKERGFNQAAALADCLAEATGIPFIENALQRVKETNTQTKLNFKERAENLKGAFLGGENAKLIKGKTVLLVDDVFTTGATSEACARALLKLKAAKIYVLTFAHTVLK